LAYFGQSHRDLNPLDCVGRILLYAYAPVLFLANILETRNLEGASHGAKI
jgi:hypothetical protein